MLKVSIVTVCFNCENTIESTIISVLNQNYKNIEYIIIDGSSTDNTTKIINKYKDKIKVVISEKDNGIYNAINKGIKLATGDIISLIHGNDIFANYEVVREAVEHYKNEKKMDILIGDVAFKKNLSDKRIVRYYPSKTFKTWMLRIGYSPPHLSSFFSRRAIDFVGSYEENFVIAGDFDYFVRCFLVKKLKFKKINYCMVYMSTGGTSGKNFKSYFLSSKEINYSLKKNGIYSNIFLTYLRFPLKLLQIFYRWIN